MSDYEEDPDINHGSGDDDGDDADIQYEVDEEENEEDDKDENDANLIENTYYNAKGTIEENADEALELFQAILDMEEEKGKWGFKALKQMIKLNIKLENWDAMFDAYKQFMTYTSVVSRNDCEKAINKLLSLVSTAAKREFVVKCYDETLKYLEKDNNEKLWFNTKLKLAQMYYDWGQYDKLQPLITELKKWCLNPDGTENPKKASQLLDISVLEIQLYTELGASKKLKQLVPRCIKVATSAVVLNPRVTGIIRECSGKMNMKEKEWDAAHEDFMEAFKSYDEAGNQRRFKCLKYLVLANMLMGSTSDPFEAPEARPYKHHKEIDAMRNLIRAYQKEDIKTFEEILRLNKKEIAEDDFMKNYINDLLKIMRSKVVLSLIRPYTRIHLNFIAKQLVVTPLDVENLCVDLILDGKLDGHIDQINQYLHLNKIKSETSRYQSCSKWADKLADIHTALLSKVG